MSMATSSTAIGVPEISNLSTAYAHRNRGVATAIIGSLEAVASKAGKIAIGIGVGLYADYGDAQRLYVRLGFKPDGRASLTKVAWSNLENRCGLMMTSSFGCRSRCSGRTLHDLAARNRASPAASRGPWAARGGGLECSSSNARFR